MTCPTLPPILKRFKQLAGLQLLRRVLDATNDAGSDAGVAQRIEIFPAPDGKVTPADPHFVRN